MTSKRAVECLPLAILDLPVLAWHCRSGLNDVYHIGRATPSPERISDPLAGRQGPHPVSHPRVLIIPSVAILATLRTAYSSQTTVEKAPVKRGSPSNCTAVGRWG